MASARDGLVAILKREKPEASLDLLKDLVSGLEQADIDAALTPVTSLYCGWRKKLVIGLGVAAVVFAIASIPLVQGNRKVAFGTYAFWAIAPPAWFFVEWAWIFESYGDPDRTAQFKTSVELAQKFWAGVLVMLGVLIVLSQGVKPEFATNPQPTTEAAPAPR